MTQAKPVNRQNPTSQQTLLLAADLKNSVLAELDAGNPNRSAYSPYGQQSSERGVMTRLGFNGELREAKLGWYLLGNGYRAYNPRLMRFHSPDSLSPFGEGGINSYAFCSGEPVSSYDPSGHIRIKILPIRSLPQRPSVIIKNPNRVNVIVENPNAKMLKPAQTASESSLAELKIQSPISTPIAWLDSAPRPLKKGSVEAAAPNIAPSQLKSNVGQLKPSKPPGMPELTRVDDSIQQSQMNGKRKMPTLPISATEGEIKKMRWLSPVVSLVRNS